jgi:hypothetical protein
MTSSTSNNDNDFVKHPSIALFGPQITDWASEGLAGLQSTLVNDTTLDLLRETLFQIPEFWRSLTLPEVHTKPSPYSLPKDESLQKLSEFAAGQKSMRSEDLTNIHLAPLTMVAHAVGLIHRVIGLRADEETPGMPEFQAVRGLCIGFLSATTVATSRHWNEFKKAASAGCD